MLVYEPPGLRQGKIQAMSSIKALPGSRLLLQAIMLSGKVGWRCSTFLFPGCYLRLMPWYATAAGQRGLEQGGAVGLFVLEDNQGMVL